jgi:hypothetical protein
MDMKKQRGIATAATAILLAGASGVLASTYYPYPVYDEYYQTHSIEPPATAKEPPPPPPQVEVVLPPTEQPIKLTEPPEFIFPPGLEFGVAVGIPYDLFYLSKTYYLAKDGRWYRAASYDGPWLVIGITRVPPELRRKNISKIRDLRNAEFRKYWKNKEQYKGKVFRPGEEMRLPLKHEKRP